MAEYHKTAVERKNNVPVRFAVYKNLQSTNKNFNFLKYYRSRGFCQMNSNRFVKSVHRILNLPNVSERLSADQLWFRIISGLFQSCSFPEKLWSSAEQRWFSNNSEWQFLIHYLLLFQNFLNYLDFEAHMSGLQPNLRKEVHNKNLLVPSSYRPKYKTNLKFWVYCYP